MPVLRHRRAIERQAALRASVGARARRQRIRRRATAETSADGVVERPPGGCAWPARIRDVGAATPGQQCGRIIVGFEASAAQPVSSRHNEAIHQPVAVVPSLLEDRDAVVRGAEHAVSEVFRSHPCHLRPPPSEEMVTPWPAVARDDVYRRARVYEVTLRALVALGREQTLVCAAASVRLREKTQRERLHSQ